LRFLRFWRLRFSIFGKFWRLQVLDESLNILDFGDFGNCDFGYL